jgi:hypothetical protein
VGGAPRSLSAEELAAAFGGHVAKNTAVVVEADQVASWDHTKLSGKY